jgi:hypothetical protein
LTETLRIANLVEEERRNDQFELATVKDQMMQFQREYVQYKAEANRLQEALRIVEENLGGQLRDVTDRERE